MLNTTRTTPIPNAPSSRTAQNMQRKRYADGSSFRVLTTPIVTSFPYSTTVSLEPGFHANDRRNHEQRSPLRERSARYVAVADAKNHIPRQFLDSERNPSSRKMPPINYPFHPRPQNGDVAYQQPPSDYFLSSGYGDYSTTDTPSRNYTLVVSGDFAPGSPGGSSDLTESSPPTTPVDSHQPLPVPSMPFAKRTVHSASIVDRPDVSCNAPHILVAEPNLAPAFRSRVDDIDNGPDGSGAGEQPYAESVLSIESEDTVHRLARINAQYNATASAFYGTLQRDSPSQHGQHRVPSIVPSVERISTPVAPRTPRASETRQAYTDGPLSSSPTQMSYLSDSANPPIYRSNTFRGPPQGNMQQPFPLYGPPSHASSMTHPSTRSSPNHGDFLPLLKPLDLSRISSTPNSPLSPHPRPNEQFPPPPHFPYQSMRLPDRDNARPLPIPPPLSRRYSIHAGPPEPKEEILAHYDTIALPQEGPTPWDGEAVQTGLLLRDERRRDDKSPPRQHMNPFGDPGRVPDLIPSLAPHGPRFISKPDDFSNGSRVPYIPNPPFPPHGPRFIGNSQSPERSKPSRAERDPDGSFSERLSSDRSTSPRNRQDQSARPTVPTLGMSGFPPEQGRRRKDSFAADPRYGTSSTVPLDFILPPGLVPIVRQSPPRPEEASRSPSRISPPHGVHQSIYQQPVKRHSGDPQPFSRPPSAAPEPHRRYSDSDAPAPFPPFFVPEVSSRTTQPVPMITRTASSARSVRWNDGPASRPQRREGWFNRRGDQLWANDGLYMPAPAGQEYPPDLDDYPEYGEGWMNEKGIRIDMGHHLMPKAAKAPLRPALKQTQLR